MGNENIKIIVGGDPSGFTKAARDVTASTERMRTGMRDAAGAVQPFNNSVTAAGDALKKITPGANQASNAMLNLGRIVQDAPFGFVGISNNISPLLESFQRLRAETGSTGAAFKALGASFAGGAGLGLAVSLITSALTVFSLSNRSAAESLEGFAKAQKEANEEAGKQLAHVQVLNAVITDSTRTQQDRSKAAKDLSGILKDLNVNMSQEAILNGQVADATKKATQAILERAKARAAEDRIAELSGQQLQRDIKRKEVIDQLAKATQNLNNQQKIQSQVIGGSTAGVGGNTIGATQRVISLQNQIKDLDGATAAANKEIQKLLGTITNQDLNVEFKGGNDKVVDGLKQRIAALKEIQSLQGLDAKQQVELVQLEIKLVNRDGPKLGFNPKEIKQQADAILEKAFPVKTAFELETVITTRVNKLEILPPQNPQELTKGFETDIAKAVNPEGKPLEIPAPEFGFINVAKETQKAMDQFKAMAVSVATDASNIIGESLAQAINGESLGAVLANAAHGLMGIVGNVLQEVGKNMILASTAVEALTDALNALFGVGGAIAGIAAGALLVATGAVLKNVNIPAFAAGGIVTRPTLGLFGEAGPEAIMPLHKMPDLISDSLKMQLPQIAARLNVNNQQPIVINGNMRINGTDLELMLQRVEGRRNRLG